MGTKPEGVMSLAKLRVTPPQGNSRAVSWGRCRGQSQRKEAKQATRAKAGEWSHSGKDREPGLVLRRPWETPGSATQSPWRAQEHSLSHWKYSALVKRLGWAPHLPKS